MKVRMRDLDRMAEIIEYASTIPNPKYVSGTFIKSSTAAHYIAQINYLKKRLVIMQDTVKQKKIHKTS